MRVAIVYWSKYNTAFRSRNNGAFVYNALSNSLIQLDDALYESLYRLAAGGNPISTDNLDNEFLILLSQKSVLTPNPERRFALTILILIFQSAPR
jgi:uncharacterized protein